MADDVGICPAPIPAELVARALAAREAFVAAMPAMRAVIHELREAMSAIEVYRYDEGLTHNDDLIEWIMNVIHPAFEIGTLIDPDEEWWYNAEANAAEKRDHAKWLLTQ